MTGWRPIICIVAALGCSGNHSAGDHQPNAGQSQDSGAMLASSLQVEVGDNDVRLVFHITNTSNQPVVLEFGTGQRYDFAVRQGDREVWRWSADMMFTQALESVTIPAAGNVTYETRYPLRETGTFTAIAELKATNYPLTQRTTFERRPK